MTSRPEEPAAHGIPKPESQAHHGPAHLETPVWEVPHVSSAPDAPRNTTPGSFSYESGTLPVGQTPEHVERRIDAATIATLFASLPWVSGSFIAVVLVLMTLDLLLPIGALVGPVALAWLASGVLVFVPRAEPYIAHLLLGLRQPTDSEGALIGGAWQAVAERATVDPRSYSLWVDDRDAPTACVPGGGILAVPHAAMRIPARQRAAVIAHELGHHLAGHARARMLVQWYSAPARWVVRAYRAVLRTTGRGGQVAGPAGAMVGCILGVVWLLIGFAVLLGLYTEPWLRLAIPVLLVLPWLSRWAEKRCDRVAADLGFGPDLMDLFRDWQESGRGDGSASGAIGRLFASQPTVGARMQALQKYLTEKGLS